MTITNINNFRGWLSLIQSSNLEDNQFEVLNNMFYNKDKRLQTRRGIKNFWNSIWSSPITSYFFYKNDTTWVTMALCSAWTNIYKYDESTWDWNSIKSWLSEFEADWITRTRRSFAVYLNKVYMCNGVDCYSEYDWTTYNQLWLSSVGTCTFDYTTDIITKATHWLSNWDSIFFSSTWTLPDWITSGKFYYVITSTTNTFQLSLTPSWQALNFADNWTGTHSCFKTSQPRVRYLRYMADSIYWSWADLTPNTIYATQAWASTWQVLNYDSLDIWADELWRVNWILDLWNLILAFKNKKIYSISWDLSSSQAIDSQNGWYCHRSLRNVENAIMYYSDSWIDRVRQRNWTTWASALYSEWLSDDLKILIDKITPNQRNNSAWYYNTVNNNYYFSFDTWNDWVPDTTLVYSSLVGKWSQYTIPPAYDYWLYLDEDWVEHILIASASWWQMFEIETWFTDFDLAIETELKTKQWDFWDVGSWKTFDLVDISWYKNEWSEITIEIIIDWEVVTTAILNDDYININSSVLTIWSYPIWSYSIWWWSSSWSDIDLFRYMIRIPMYSSWNNIQVRMYSNYNPNVWTLDQIRISRENEVIDMFPIANIS